MRRSVHRFVHVFGGVGCAGLLLAAGAFVTVAPAKSLAPVAANTAPAKSSLRTIALRKLGSIHLEGVSDEEAVIGGFSAFDVDDRGRFGFLKGCGCQRTFVLVDSDGKLARKIVLPKPLDEKQTERKAIWIRGDQWLVVASNDENGGKSTAQWVDTATGNVTEIAGFAAPPVKALAGTHDGGFVALVNTAPAGSNESDELALMAFDRIGRKLWTVRQSGNADAVMAPYYAGMQAAASRRAGAPMPAPPIPGALRLLEAENLAVTRGGQIVVYAGMPQRLEIYGRDGAFRRHVAVGESDSPATYDLRIDDDGAGGVIVSSEHGTALRIAIDRAGPAETWKPATQEGRRIAMTGGVIAAPDGHLWTSDGYAFLRLDSRGVADRTVGEPFEPDHLGSVAELTATRSGRIYALDARTHAVHVFDSDGKRLQVERPAPGDSTESSYGSSMVATDAGDVYLPQSGGSVDEPGPVHSFVHFTPDGHRAGIQSTRIADEYIHQWIAQPGSANRWALGMQGMYLIDPQGKVVGKFDQGGNGQVSLPMRVLGGAADGSLLAMVAVNNPTDVIQRGERRPRFELMQVSASGAVVGHWPSSIDSYVGKSDFDGAHIAMTKYQQNESREAVLVADPRGRALYRVQLAPDQTISALFLARRDGVPELWLFDGKATIDRYRLE